MANDQVWAHAEFFPKALLLAPQLISYGSEMEWNGSKSHQNLDNVQEEPQGTLQSWVPQSKATQGNGVLQGTERCAKGHLQPLSIVGTQGHSLPL